ncbi:MAG: hypothetical protein HYX69_14985 [Planctomycetia bacterium]|nr:hypothetical protein [Planctomycetia bacterium]
MLVVLILLALFTMLLITFVVNTTGNKIGVQYAARVEQTDDPPSSLLYRALMQVVRGPRNLDSVMVAHSLLEDMYGHRSVIGRIDLNSVGPIAGGEIITFTSSFVPPKPWAVGYTPPPTMPVPNLFPPSAAPGSTEVDPTYGFYSGRVITMLDGDLAGQSSRIVGYTYAGGVSSFQVMSFDGRIPTATGSLGPRFLINGQAFSGTGFGFRPQSFNQNIQPLDQADVFTRLLDATTWIDPTPSSETPKYSANNPNPNRVLGLQYALLPNHRRGVFTPYTGDQPPTGSSYNAQQLAALTALTQYLDPAGPGGANEDYDAVDYQNMILAMRVWSPGLNPLANPPPGSLVTLLPSLHRPELVNYWNLRWKQQVYGGMGNDLLTDAGDSSSPNYQLARALLRKIVLRPLVFSDENPNFPPMTLLGPNWDVDNDGDGQPDSIWVDLGMPVQTAPDGRRYKPMFAILCIDMDGKLNLNAHGSREQIPPPSSASRFDSVAAPFAFDRGTKPPTPGFPPPPIPQPYILHMGQGYGPPEISLHPLFEPVVTGSLPTGDLQRLLCGDASQLLDGRYGEIRAAAAGLLNVGPETFDLTKLPGPGISRMDDPLNWIGELGYPSLYCTGTAPPGALGAFPQYTDWYIRGPRLPATQPYQGTYPPYQFDNTVPASGFGTPPDLNGTGMMALDLRGQPMFLDFAGLANPTQRGVRGWGERDETVDDAYELDLSLNAPHGGYRANTSPFVNWAPNALSASQVDTIDAPFTPAEVERVLRPYDSDASTLPDRLLRLAPNAFTNPQPRGAARYPNFPELAQMPNLVTWGSFDVPSPNTIFTSPELAGQLFAAAAAATNPPQTPAKVPSMFDSNITQLVRARIIADSLRPPVKPVPANLDASIALLVSPDLAGGEKMNINRPVGNGRDDNSNLFVDEPGENEAAWISLDNTSSPTAVQLDLNDDGTPNDGAGDLLARQNLARHLYVLMMLLKDDQFQVQVDVDGDGFPGKPADTAYWFAQWAINIVDFRDPDSIMTPFEFDISPFVDDATPPSANTWNVDGLVASSTPLVTSADDVQPWRGLVWGCERPELLLTEIMATHDRRSRDTNKDTTRQPVDRSPMSGKDDDFDQVRRPQGSLFIELFNPNPPFVIGGNAGADIPGVVPRDLYAPVSFTDAATGAQQFGVNLAAQLSNAPVWRIAVARRVTPKQYTLPLPVTFPAAAQIGRTSPQPVRPVPRMPVLPPNEIDRVLYFTPVVPPIQFDELPTRRFAAPGTVPVVPPNHYALIGPGGPATADPYAPAGAPAQMVTHLGIRDRSKDTPPNGAASETALTNYYPRRIALSPTVTVWNDITAQALGAYANSADLKPVINIPIVSITTQADDGTVPQRTLRFSVSEPNLGYPVPGNAAMSKVKKVLAPAQLDNENAYYDQSDPIGIPDAPYDEDKSATAVFSQVEPDDIQRQSEIIGTDSDKTILRYTTVYLQRLANPLLPWDREANPYIIVDEMPVDLTTYNSEKGLAPTGGNEEFPAMAAAAFKFDTRRRAPTPTDPTKDNNPWYQYARDMTNGPRTDPVNGTAANPIPMKAPTDPPGTVGSTLGYLNDEFGNLNAESPWLNRFTASDATTAMPNTIAVVNAGEYRGDPTLPFPWLTWNDRPYVSSKELMLVPTSSPAGLLSEATLSVASVPAFDPYGIKYDTTTQILPPAEFGYLPNLFDSPDYTGGTPQPSANLYRFMEYLQVPSRFTGTATWLPPRATGPGTGPHRFHPPFNSVSRHRDPGKVNINTIFDPFVLQGIIDNQASPNLGSYPPWRALWELVSTRRAGFGTATNPVGGGASPLDQYGYPKQPLSNIIALQPPPIPTLLQPFRTYAGNTLVPLAGMRYTPATTREREIESTLFRSTANNALFPLLKYRGPTTPTNLTWADGTGLFDEPARNPYFAYQAYRRLDNLLTTRSNVYSIWITVGYFEVTPAPSVSVDADAPKKYPDGWVLGRELGSDTGDIKRHRAFYMYDRSIPVGFERGENHNVDRGILLERFIE